MDNEKITAHLIALRQQLYDEGATPRSIGDVDTLLMLLHVQVPSDEPNAVQRFEAAITCMLKDFREFDAATDWMFDHLDDDEVHDLQISDRCLQSLSEISGEFRKLRLRLKRIGA